MYNYVVTRSHNKTVSDSRHECTQDTNNNMHCVSPSHKLGVYIKILYCLSLSGMSLPLYPAGLEQSQEEQTGSEPWLLVAVLVC